MATVDESRDRQTDTQPLHRPCTAYYASSVKSIIESQTCSAFKSCLRALSFSTELLSSWTPLLAPAATSKIKWKEADVKTAIRIGPLLRDAVVAVILFTSALQLRLRQRCTHIRPYRPVACTAHTDAHSSLLKVPSHLQGYIIQATVPLRASESNSARCWSSSKIFPRR